MFKGNQFYYNTPKLAPTVHYSVWETIYIPFKFPKKTEKKFFPNTDCAKLSNTDDTVVHKLYGVL